MANSDIVIAGAGRTAVGSFNGAFANIPAHELGAAVVKDVHRPRQSGARRRSTR